MQKIVWNEVFLIRLQLGMRGNPISYFRFMNLIFLIFNGVLLSLLHSSFNAQENADKEISFGLVESLFINLLVIVVVASVRVSRL